MTQSSPTVDASARKMVSTVLQVLQEPGRAVAIATALGVSESTVSRLKNEHLETLCSVLAYAGLKLVPADAHVVAKDKIEALLLFAKAHLARVESAADLTIDSGP
jgi:hypothetical protein